jgi:hypothetical protein
MKEPIRKILSDRLDDDEAIELCPKCKLLFTRHSLWKDDVCCHCAGKKVRYDPAKQAEYDRRRRERKRNDPECPSSRSTFPYGDKDGLD